MMHNDPRNIMPGDKVKVFDTALYINDKTTPSNVTWKTAIVMCRYGKKSKAIDMEGFWTYPDLVDVRFEHSGRVSHGHFTDGVELVDN